MTLDEMLQKFDTEFSELVYQRWGKGAKEYGPVAFLGNDIFQFIYEEFADTVNYSRMQYMKLRMIEEALHERGIDLSNLSVGEVRKTDSVPSGTPSFVGIEEILRLLPREETER